ncbi:MAG: hypothetical protein ACQEUK_05130 [Pseudomonadota bacterium]
MAGHAGTTKWQGMQERGNGRACRNDEVEMSFPATTPRHSRVGLSGIHLDLSLQQPENPAHRLMPVSLN